MHACRDMQLSHDVNVHQPTWEYVLLNSSIQKCSCMLIFTRALHGKPERVIHVQQARRLIPTVLEIQPFLLPIAIGSFTLADYIVHYGHRNSVHLLTPLLTTMQDSYC